MISVNPSSFGRLIGAVRRYPGGTEKLSIFFTLSREIPNRRAASRALIPSRWARRTFRYSSTVKMPPPSLLKGRAKVAEFYSASSGTIPPLPWHTFPPPFSDPPAGLANAPRFHQPLIATVRVLGVQGNTLRPARVAGVLHRAWVAIDVNVGQLLACLPPRSRSSEPSVTAC